jgi:hypothetical protein
LGSDSGTHVLCLIPAHKNISTLGHASGRRCSWSFAIKISIARSNIAFALLQFRAVHKISSANYLLIYAPNKITKEFATQQRPASGSYARTPGKVNRRTECHIPAPPHKWNFVQDWRVRSVPGANSTALALFS